MHIYQDITYKLVQHYDIVSSYNQTSFGDGHHRHQGRQHHRPKIPLLEGVCIVMHTPLYFVSLH